MNTPARNALPTNQMAIWSMVLGILGWVMCPLFSSAIAVVLGHMARAEIKRNQGQMEGDGYALVGLILGWANIAMCIAFILFYIILILFFAGVAGGLGR